MQNKTTPEQYVAIIMLLAIAITFVYVLQHNNSAINHLITTN